jgi:hypothetical protein
MKSSTKPVMLTLSDNVDDFNVKLQSLLSSGFKLGEKFEDNDSRYYDMVHGTANVSVTLHSNIYEGVKLLIAPADRDKILKILKDTGDKELEVLDRS